MKMESAPQKALVCLAKNDFYFLVCAISAMFA